MENHPNILLAAYLSITEDNARREGGKKKKSLLSYLGIFLLL